ncbi:ATP-binding protein [Kribbella sp. NPDC004536]|uniref:ATP-binding protein n=1 Tax=Kribbella sp. NPDC004536 TaxID=3364106 RepID=UPI003697E576
MTVGTARSADSGLVERADEMLGIEATLDEVAESGAGRMVIVQGPAGIGKTSLLNAAGTAARRRGYAVLAARGNELQQEFGWDLVLGLFERVQAESTEIVRATPAAALAVEMLASEQLMPPEAQSGEYAMLHSLLWLTNHLASRQRLMLVVDDLHWADQSSLRYLAYLAQRIDGMPVVVLAAARPGAATLERSLSMMVESPAAMVRVLRPLSPEGVSEMLAGALGRPQDAATVARCHELTLGNPLFVRELSRELAGAGNTSGVQAVLSDSVPGIDRYVMRQVGRLPKSSRDVIEALSVLGDQCAVNRLALVVDQPVMTVLEALSVLQVGELVRGTGEPRKYSIAHPLARAAIYRALPDLTRVELRARAAAVALQHHEIDQAAAHVLLLPPGAASFEISGVLAEAAHRSMVRGSTKGAVAFLRRQLDEDLGIERQDVLVRLAMAEVATNDPRSQQDLADALANATDPEQRTMLTIALVATMFDTPDRGLALLKAILDAAHELTDSDRFAVEAFRTLFVHLAATKLDLDSLLRGLELLPTDRSFGGRALDIEIGLMRYFRANRPAALERVARGMEDDTLFADPRAEFAVGSAWHVMLGCDAPELLGSLDRAIQYGRSVGSARVLGVAHCYRSGLMLAHGNLHEAIEDGEVSWETCRVTEADGRLLWIGNYLMQALVAAGDVRKADSIRQELKRDRPPLASPIEADGEITVLIAQRRIDEALAAIEEARRGCERLGIRNPVFTDWRSHLVRCLHLRAEDDEARAIADENLSLAREWGTPAGVGSALRTLATASETDELRIEILREAERLLATSSARYELAQCQFELGDALRRVKHVADARRYLQSSLELAEVCGAKPLRSQAISTFRLIGVRPVTSTRLGAGSLTPGEIRVAQLAAEGMSNRDIAQSLFVTVKTVEVHLGNTYRKLGIRQRRELGQALTV